MQAFDLPPDHFLPDRIVARHCLFERHAADWPVPAVGASGSLLLVFACGHADLSRFNQFSFCATNLGGRPVLVEMQLLHGAGRTAAIDTPQSLCAGRTLLPPGRPTELRFPVEAFGTYGLPNGWRDIESLHIVFKPDQRQAVQDAIRVETGSIFAQTRILSPGPRLTATGLAAVLKTDVPDLWDRATPYGPAHYRHLAMPVPHGYRQEAANAILAGRIMGQRLSQPLDWGQSPTGLLEWDHFFHRHHFLRPVVAALARAGAGRYADYLGRTVSHWIAANPVPVNSNGGTGPGWETLSAAWRLREWLWIMGIGWPCPGFGEPARQVMLASFWEHGRHLAAHQGHPNNWIMVESAALALVGMCLPQFSEAHRWAEQGLGRLAEAFARQFLADGIHDEFSPLYQAICLEACLEVKRVAAFYRRQVPEMFGAPLAKAVAALAALCRPDFTWPAFNDSGGVSADYTAVLRLAGALFDRPDFDWLGSKGARGLTPRATMQVLPEAGIGVMRTGHDRQAHWLVFRSGPAGLTHFHEDVLSLEVVAHGIPKLVDPGISGYAPGPMTDHYRSAAAHNSLLVDGQGPLRAALGLEAAARPAGDRFCWVNDGDICGMTGTCPDYRDSSGAVCRVTRTVLFVDGRGAGKEARCYWLVRDSATGAGVHTLTACWQCFPGKVAMEDATRIIHMGDTRQKGLLLVPYAGFERARVQSAAGCRRPWGGWVAVHGRDVPATCFQFSVEARLPITLDWIVYPIGRRWAPFWQHPGFAAQMAQRFAEFNHRIQKGRT